MSKNPIKTIALASLLLLLRCNNYNLLSQLENPGSAGTTGKGSCGTACRIFATAATYSGDLGGMPGADAKCVADANNPAGSGNGIWRAMLGGNGRTACINPNCGVSGATEHFDWVLKANTTYRRPDGATIFTTGSVAIGAFNWPGTISTTSTNMWTGLDPTWITVNRCTNTGVDWTNSSAGAQGCTGIANQATNQAISANCTNTCDIPKGLYCVEQ